MELEEFTPEMDAEDFLEIVWGEGPAWVDVPSRVGRYWVSWPYEWPAPGAFGRRIDSCVRDREDVYYSVTQFSEKGRKIENVLPCAWLWADLDEVEPQRAAELGFPCTIAVRSSPNRYQALWRLSRELEPKTLAKLNKGLTYALGADKGGWDLTQVLRLPGTWNYKYAERHFVEVLWHDISAVYDPKAVWAAVKETVPKEQLAYATGNGMVRKPIPARAKALLGVSPAEVVHGERSDRLWELECLLAEAGLSEKEIFDLVVETPWNKWAGQHGGRDRLLRDVRRALNRVRRKSGEAPKVSEEAKESRLPWISLSTFMRMKIDSPLWLVEGMWVWGSNGFIAGEPKTQKTTLALGIGVSVATGRNFLGEVHNPGPVLMVQEENAPWMMQDRIRKIMAKLDVDPETDPPFKILNNFGFNLDLDEHRNILEAEVEEFKPVLLILDPMYLIVPVDQDRASDLQPFLRWLLQLRVKYNCAIIIVHHMRKESAGSNIPPRRAGQRLLGSTTLHGWSDSSLYTSAREDEREGWTKTLVQPEFRSIEPQSPIELALHMGRPGTTDMELEKAPWNFEAHIMGLVAHEGGSMEIRGLAARLEMDYRELKGRLVGSPHFEVDDKGGRGRPATVYLIG